MKGLQNERGWNLHVTGLYPKLGIKGTKLPDGALPPVNVNGITVFVISKETAKARGLFHRVRCYCKCGAEMSAGRLHQHVCAQPEGV